jgi:hypothetical protein
VINNSILERARGQHGLVTRQQLLDCGLGRSFLARAVERQWFRRLLPTVYLIAPAPDTFAMRCRAVQLWCGEVGFTSAMSAGRVHGLARMGRKYPIMYTVPRSVKRAAPPWITLRRTTWYHPKLDRTILRSGLTVATPERMLFSLAAERNFRYRFDDAADDAWNLRLTTPTAMSAYLEHHRCRGKDGVATLERWLERALERERPAQSFLERDLLNALEGAGLPEPIRQYELHLPESGRAIHIDIAWPDIRLGIEPGHSRFHEGETAYEQDTLRDLACRQLGWEIQRLTQGIRNDLPGLARRLRIVHQQRRRDLLPHTTFPIPKLGR